jgi:hypothetical protein
MLLMIKLVPTAATAAPVSPGEDQSERIDAEEGRQFQFPTCLTAAFSGFT